MKASAVLVAPAKLNLTLEVLARRADGLHGVRSVMIPVDICDRLQIAPAQEPAFTCSREDLTQDNIVARAQAALSGSTPFSVHLEKRIPTGAGMGGGSSDAAALLLAAANGMLGDASAADYLALARSLGSDVPFFLVQAPALVEGTGERVTALGSPPPWHAVVVQPPVAVSTAWAYARLDETDRPGRARNASASLELGEALQRREFDVVVALMQNDFHDVIAAEHAEIRTALDALQAAGAPRAMLTGSGSCVFTLARDEAQRADIAQQLQLPEEYATYECAFFDGHAWRSAA